MDDTSMPRRQAIGTMALGAVGSAAVAMVPGQAAAAPVAGGLVHHVVFFLKRPSNAADRADLIAGLRTLAAGARDIQYAHIGVPAPSERSVVDGSYDVAWTLHFADTAAQDRYQVDPVHLRFVDTCQHLWDRVVVHDSLAV